MRLGIFGGAFDPVHYGHLLLAETCREQCRLDQVWFMPAAIPPHKQTHQLAAAKLRVEMLKLAIAGYEPFRVSEWEIERGGVSYTVDTLTALRATYPAAELFFLMGADSLRDLPTWRSPEKICDLATPIVVRRQGVPEPDFSSLASVVSTERIAAFRESQVEMPVLELSSTDIRQRIRTGNSIRFRTPRAVEKLIETERLYTESK